MVTCIWFWFKLGALKSYSLVYWRVKGVFRKTFYFRALTDSFVSPNQNQIQHNPRLTLYLLVHSTESYFFIFVRNVKFDIRKQTVLSFLPFLWLVIFICFKSNSTFSIVDYMTFCLRSILKTFFEAFTATDCTVVMIYRIESILYIIWW